MESPLLSLLSPQLKEMRLRALRAIRFILVLFRFRRRLPWRPVRILRDLLPEVSELRLILE